MKKITTLSLIVLYSLFISCKKEVNQKEVVKSISTSVNSKNCSKKEFDEKIFPLVEELYQQDSVKYRLINHIAQKAKKEKNSSFFVKNVSDLKSELKFVQ